MTVVCRGVRGATTADGNTPEAIVSATRDLLEALVAENHIAAEDVASVFFTTTPDLTAAFPARAARDMGWYDTACLGATEADVEGAPARCIRILIHWNTVKPQSAIRHVYLKGAAGLRPDRVPSPSSAPRADG